MRIDTGRFIHRKRRVGEIPCLWHIPRPRAGVSVYGRTGHKCAATATLAGGMVAAMDELEQKYLALVERIRRYPMSEAARARIVIEIVLI